MKCTFIYNSSVDDIHFPNNGIKCITVRLSADDVLTCITEYNVCSHAWNVNVKLHTWETLIGSLQRYLNGHIFINSLWPLWQDRILILVKVSGVCSFLHGTWKKLYVSNVGRLQLLPIFCVSFWRWPFTWFSTSEKFIHRASFRRERSTTYLCR